MKNLNFSKLGLATSRKKYKDHKKDKILFNDRTCVLFDSLFAFTHIGRCTQTLETDTESHR